MADDDLLNDPSTAYIKLNEQEYKAELELVDRYKSFVAEMLRLSVAGIAVFGFLYKDIFKSETSDPLVIYLAAMGLIAFALSTVSALIFQYFANEGFRWYIVGLRSYTYKKENPTSPKQIPDTEKNVKKAAKRRHIYCLPSKVFSAVFLGLGAIFMALAIMLPSLKNIGECL